MAGRSGFVVRYRRVAWLTLLVPVSAVVEAVVDVVDTMASGTGRVVAVLYLLGTLLLAGVVLRHLWRVLNRAVIVADPDRLVVGTLLDSQIELPWEAVSEIRVHRTKYGGKLAVAVPDSDRHSQPVSTDKAPDVANLREPLRTIVKAPWLLDDWLEHRWRRHGQLTVPVLLTSPAVSELTAPLTELAAGRCPVVDDAQDEAA